MAEPHPTSFLIVSGEYHEIGGVYL